MRAILIAALSAALISDSVSARADDSADSQVEAAAAAYQAGRFREAIERAEKAEKADSKNAKAPLIAGLAFVQLRENDSAVKALTRALTLDPKNAIAYDRRGDAYLKSGRFKEAIADFDQFLKMQPKLAPEHWRRGIALYYAGRFDDGRKQFDLHRTVNPEDVENSAWHYLCNARAASPKKARADLIPVTKDARVPMKQVLELFAGKLKPQDVLDAAENSGLTGQALQEARFYARQYVALYYESEGDKKKAREYLTEAVEKYKIGHYMWDVGAAHLKLLTAKK